MIEVGGSIGNYRILEEIGMGGMGKVYRGLDTMLEREVAIKVLRPELTMHHSLVERFRKEAMVLARLNHPNIAMLYNLFHQGNLLFMVMEFVRGETLEWQLKKSGALPYERAIALFAQVLEAIGYAHQNGVIHRDLKPSNIMILPNDGVKVMDFGIARVLGTERMTREGSFVGTLEYMAPEQIRGHESNEAADIYSLGVLLYEMLSGRLPFSSPNQFDLMRAHIEAAPPPPRQYAPHIPEYVEQAILRALAKNQEDRFRSAREFRAALLKGVPLPEMGGPVTRPLRETAVYGPPTTVGDDQSDVARLRTAEDAAAEARRQLIEEARKQAREEASRIAEEERRKLIEEARKQAEQEAARFAETEQRRLIEEARRQAEQEAARLAEVERLRLIEEARKQAEQEAAERAAAERQRMVDEARKRAEHEAAERAASERLRLVEAARRQAEQQAAHLAVAERQRLIEEARKQAEQEAARLAAEEEQQLVEQARRQAEQEAARFAAEERQRLIEQAHKRAEQEAAARAAVERQRLFEEARNRAEQEATARASGERQRLLEESRKQVEEEVARIAAEEEQKLFEEARKKAEEEAAALVAQERTRLLEKALRQAEQEASKRASAERQRLVEAARKQAEEEAARLGAEEQRKLVEQARKQAEREAAHLAGEERKRLIEEAHKQAEQEAGRRAAAERQRLIEEARKRAEHEAAERAAAERQRLVEEARKLAELEAERLGAEMEQHLVEQARRSAEQEVSRLAEEERQRLLGEARRRAEQQAAERTSKERQRLVEEARKRAEREAANLAEEERERRVEEALRQAEQEAAKFAEEELQRLLEESRKKTDREVSRRAEKERKRLFAEERKRAKQEAQRQSAELIASQDPYGTSLLSDKSLPPERGATPSLHFPSPTGRRFSLPVVIGGSAVVLLLLVTIIFFALRGGWTPSPPTDPPTDTGKPDMVRIEGGAFRMGRDDGPQPAEDTGWAELQRPAHEMRVGSFEMDRTEVTNAEYEQFVRENGHQPPLGWIDGKPPAGQEKWPARNVSFEDAQAFAAWRSKRDGVTYRLPTEAEWEFAARGQNSYRFPWGIEWAAGRANTGTNAPQPVGSYQQGASQFGILDLIGNVSEWTASPASLYPGNQRLTEDQLKASCDGCYVVRGGSFASSPQGESPISVTARGFFLPSFKDPKIGFRLVR